MVVAVPCVAKIARVRASRYHCFGDASQPHSLLTPSHLEKESEKTVSGVNFCRPLVEVALFCYIQHDEQQGSQLRTCTYPESSQARTCFSQPLRETFDLSRRLIPNRPKHGKLAGIVPPASTRTRARKSSLRSTAVVHVLSHSASRVYV